MSSEDRSSSASRVECQCGAVLAGRLLSEFSVPTVDEPGGRLRCPACGSELRVPDRPA